MVKRDEESNNKSGDTVGKVESFKYLRTCVQNNRGFVEEVKHRIKCERIKRREASGVLNNNRIIMRPKVKFYKKPIVSARNYNKECV